MKIRPCIRALAILASSCFFAEIAHAQSLINLGDFGGLSYGNAINNLGQVVGDSETETHYAGDRHPFFYSAGGGMVDLGKVGANTPTAVDINNLGQVVGYSGGGASYSFIATAGGGMTELTGFGPDFQNFYAFGINDGGQIVGYGYKVIDQDTWATEVRAAVMTQGGSFTEVGSWGGMSAATEINNLGQVAGNAVTADGVYHAFVTNGLGEMVDLGTLGGSFSEARGMNELGQVVGFSYTDGAMYPYGGEPHAFVASADGTITDLGFFGAANQSFYAQDINDHSVAVGWSWDHLSVFTTDSIIYKGGSAYSLNSLYSDLLSDGTTPGFTWLQAATGINNSGQITGYGDYFDGKDTMWKAFLLTPGEDDRIPNGAPGRVPDQSGTLAPLAVILPLIAMLRRRITGTD